MSSDNDDKVDGNYEDDDDWNSGYINDDARGNGNGNNMF